MPAWTPHGYIGQNKLIAEIHAAREVWGERGGEGAKAADLPLPYQRMALLDDLCNDLCLF